jgi:hypothetical protein
MNTPDSAPTPARPGSEAPGRAQPGSGPDAPQAPGWAAGPGVPQAPGWAAGPGAPQGYGWAAGSSAPQAPGWAAPPSGPPSWSAAPPPPSGPQAWPAMPPAPPERRPARGGRPWLWVVLVAVGIVLAAGVVRAVVGVADPVALPELPATLAGARTSTDTAARTALDTQVTQLRSEPGVTSAVAAMYDGPEDTDRFLVVIAGTRRQNSADAVAGVIEGMRSSGAAAGMTFSDVEPGPLGGTLRCGSGTLAGTPVSLCAWAADRVIGTVLSYNNRAGSGRELTRTVRAALNR